MHVSVCESEMGMGRGGRVRIWLVDGILLSKII